MVTISGDVSLNLGMAQGEPYATSWQNIEHGEVFHLQMIDGALVQMLYTFQNSVLLKHRLAFFPRPRVLTFDSDSEVYELDEIYADIVGEGIAHVPIRFDFNQNDPANVPLHHPPSHLTLGNYPNCRIPVSAPLSPRTFMGFILRSFYHNAYRLSEDAIQLATQPFPKTLFDEEAHSHYFSVPHEVA